MIRLLTFIPGEILHKVPYTPHIMYNTGQTLGRINTALKVKSGERKRRTVCIYFAMNKRRDRGKVGREREA